MKPYGWRMKANAFDGGDSSTIVVDKKRARREGKAQCEGCEHEC